MNHRPVRVAAGVIAIGIVLVLLGHAIGADALEQYRADLVYYTARHLVLVGYSMALALVVGVPAGVLLSRPSFSRHAERFMQIFNIGNTIPSLAVLAIALGIFGIGDRPAITALFLASLLPITRNTYEGMRNVSPALREAARGIGMTPWQSLTRVELPNSLPIIVGGIRTALAINVGSAPLAYLIGAAATAVLALVLDGIVAAGSRRALARRGLAA
jgi:osmoprotectant transport system permease protein